MGLDSLLTLGCRPVWQGGQVQQWQQKSHLQCQAAVAGMRQLWAQRSVPTPLATHRTLLPPPGCAVLCCAAEGPSSLAPLPSSMPTNLGINEAHHMMGGGGGSLHHGLPSSNSCQLARSSFQASYGPKCAVSCFFNFSPGGGTSS